MRTKSYYIIFNDRSSEELNLNIEHRVVKPTANNEYESIKIPKGKTLYRNKGYADIEITVPFTFISEPNSWERDFRNVKAWLNKKGNKILKFSDDLDVFYKVNTVSIGNEYRSKRRIGKFNVTFTCEPYTYFYDGAFEIPIEGKIELYNDYLETRPTYIIESVENEGQIIPLKVNGKVVNIVGANGLIIDTDKGLVLSKNGDLAYEFFEGNFEDLYLKEGINDIECPNTKEETVPVNSLGLNYNFLDLEIGEAVSLEDATDGIPVNSLKLNYNFLNLEMGDIVSLEDATDGTPSRPIGNAVIKIIPYWRTV